MDPREIAYGERRQMAEHIANHEPLSGDELRGALGWGFQEFFDAIHSWPDRWFTLAANGWELTGQGRKGLAAARRPHRDSAVERARIAVTPNFDDGLDSSFLGDLPRRL
jgi:hypothetical protein